MQCARRGIGHRTTWSSDLTVESLSTEGSSGPESTSSPLPLLSLLGLCFDKRICFGAGGLDVISCEGSGTLACRRL